MEHRVKARKIEQYVQGDSMAIQEAYVSIGVSEFLAHLKSAALRKMRDQLRDSVRHRLHKVWVMRWFSAGMGVLFLLLVRSHLAAAITRADLPWVLTFVVGALACMWLTSRVWFGAEIDEHLGVVKFEQQQLHQIGALLDARGVGTGRQSLWDDLRGREPPLENDVSGSAAAVWADDRVGRMSE